MPSYEYDAYRSGTDPPLVRIGRLRGAYGGPYMQGNIRVLELALDWSWSTPQEIDVGDDVIVLVSPHHNGRKSFYGLTAYGRVSACIRRYGVTVPVDMLDPRVIAGLRQREAMEQMLWWLARGAE